jgi:tetratricopeptide (TPR) repeat protein
MKRTQSAPEEYSEQAKKACAAIEAWTKQYSLMRSDITETGLGMSTIHRIKSGKEGKSLNDWLTSLAKLFYRINKVCSKKDAKYIERSWEEVFGHDFPKPRLAPAHVFSNYADVAREKVRRNSVPLIQYFDTEFKIAYEQNNISKASQFLIRLCNLYEANADWKRAAEGFELLAKLNDQTGDFHHVADSLLRQGLALFYDGDAGRAKVKFLRGLDVIKQFSYKSPPVRTELRLMNYLALAQNELGESLEARLLLEASCLPLAQTRGSKSALSSVQNRLGNVCLQLGDLRAAADYLLGALVGRLALSMRSEAARTLFSLGHVHERQEEFAHAIWIWEITSNLQQRLQDYESIAATLFELGRCYASLHKSSVWEKQTVITIALTPASFPDERELKAIQSMLPRSSADRFFLNKKGLVSAARQALEGAIYWDTENGSKRIIERAKQELDGLKPCATRIVGNPVTVARLEASTKGKARNSSR